MGEAAACTAHASGTTEMGSRGLWDRTEEAEPEPGVRGEPRRQARRAKHISTTGADGRAGGQNRLGGEGDRPLSRTIPSLPGT